MPHTPRGYTRAVSSLHTFYAFQGAMAAPTGTIRSDP
jgi:hypothetical protein